MPPNARESTSLYNVLLRHLTKKWGKRATKNSDPFPRAHLSKIRYAGPNIRNQITANGPNRIDSPYQKGYESSV